MSVSAKIRSRFNISNMRYGEKVPKCIEGIEGIKGAEHIIRITFDKVFPTENDDEYPETESGWFNEDGIHIDLDDYDIAEGITIAQKTAKLLYYDGAIEPSSTPITSLSLISPGDLANQTPPRAPRMLLTRPAAIRKPIICSK